MPAGVTWSQYLKFTSAAMLSMFAGSQTVHYIYQPLKDIDSYIDLEKSRLGIINDSLTTISPNSTEKNNVQVIAR